MEIERVNEYTLKFFISYIDIEDRGFDREEIWYNRERGEELFWEIMDEAYHEEAFPTEGPLWIQVQALEKGLEILVTRAQLSKDGSKLELPISPDKTLDIPVHEGLEDAIADKIRDESSDDDFTTEEDQDEDFTYLIGFSDIEDVIGLSEHIHSDFIDTALYHYDDAYYLYITFNEDADDDEHDNELSKILEYGEETDLTVHVVHEYGKVIIPEQAFSVLRTHFGR